MAKPNPFVVLIIMDGLGIRESETGNAVLAAKTPTIDYLWTNHSHALLKAAGKEVGLSQGDPGNSEVGHLNMGSGQIVYQSQPRIDEHIHMGKFEDIPALEETFDVVRRRKTNMHLVGLLSAAGVHAHIEHLFELLRICAKKKIDPYIHVILDGRDTGLKDGYLYLNMLNAKMQELKIGKIASICGRRFAMDRDHKWEQTERAYRAMTGSGERTAVDAMEVLQGSYAAGENDQNFTPTTMVDEGGQPIGVVGEGDAVIFFNYREDRARQLTKAFAVEEFDGFEREKIKDLHFLTMTGYEKGLPVSVLFDPFIILSTISSIVSEAGYTQLHASETEKYAHVTYFFNGGVEEPHQGEEFLNVPSPKVFDYVETPEMSAEKLTQEVINKINTKTFNFIVMNYSNPDMLGHTGSLEQTVKGIEFMDTCIREVVEAIVAQGGTFIVTADHGNCEEMVDELTGEVNTTHTSNPVPVMICQDCKGIVPGGNVTKVGTGKDAVERGILADIAPTVLSLMGLQPGPDMTGIDLLSVSM